MFRIAQSILGSADMAEEVVQQAYLRLLEKPADSIECPSAWLMKVTRNLAIDQARRSTRERELLRLLPGVNLFNSHDAPHEIEQQLSELVSCLLHVSNAHGTAVVLLHVVFGMSYQDIAKQCGRSPAACRQTASRAMRRCFDILTAGEPFDEAQDADVYVHAILDASTFPLIHYLDVASPVTMQTTAMNHSMVACSNATPRTGKTTQVLVLSPMGVKWALVLDGIVLCPLESNVSCRSVSNA